MSTPQAFIVSRTFKAFLERVWKAWTEPEPMAQWWGPKGFKAAIKTLDLRPGGMSHYLLILPQGQEMWGRLVYREVVPEKRLVYVNSFSNESAGLTRHPLHEGWPLQLLSTVTFAEEAGKTTVTVRWEPYEATDAERAVFAAGHESVQGGWSGTLNRLEAYLAQA